jgi:hypothetical protein
MADPFIRTPNGKSSLRCGIGENQNFPQAGDKIAAIGCVLVEEWF